MKRRNPVAKEVRTPKYRLRVIADKTKKLFRKRKHRKDGSRISKTD